MVVGHAGVITELPYLLIVATLTGCFTGLLAQMTVARLAAAAAGMAAPARERPVKAAVLELSGGEGRA